MSDLGEQLDRGRVSVGLESTRIALTDVGRAMALILCPLGIPYGIPASIDGEPTFRMVDS